MSARVALTLLFLLAIAPSCAAASEGTSDEASLLQVHSATLAAQAPPSPDDFLTSVQTEPCKKPDPLPWPRPSGKHCHPANNKVCASKRGLSVPLDLYKADGKVCKYLKAFQSLRPWWFNGDVQTCPLCSSAGDDYNECMFNFDSGFVPMVKHKAQLQFATEPADALLGFYKPEHGHHKILPSEAAVTWKLIEEKAADSTLPIPRVGSPAAKGIQKGFDWLDNFFSACGKNCKVDFVTARIYATAVTGPSGSLQEVLAAYAQRFGLPVWLIEFNAGGTQYDLDATAHFNFMKEALPFLEANHDVERYAWDSVCQDLVEGASLTDCKTGELTDLGIFYRDYSLVVADPHYMLPEWNSENMRLSAAAAAA